MEEKFSYDMDEKMKDTIKKIIEDSFNEIKNSSGKKAVYINEELEKIYPDKRWNILSIGIGNHNSYSYNGYGNILFCHFKKRGFIICYINTKNNTKPNSKELNEKEKLEENIKSLSNEKSSLKEKLSDSQITIKKYESIIKEQKSKLENIIIEKELLQKTIKEKEEEINNIKNGIQHKEENNSFNKTFYTRDQMIALNFLSTDSKLHYAIPCLDKDLFVDIEKKLYDKFPEYKEKNNNFLSQGKIVLRFKTVGENKLESGIPIIMKTP